MMLMLPSNPALAPYGFLHEYDWRVHVDSAGHATEVNRITGERREHVHEWFPTRFASGTGLYPGWTCISKAICSTACGGETHPDERDRPVQ